MDLMSPFSLAHARCHRLTALRCSDAWPANYGEGGDTCQRRASNHLFEAGAAKRLGEHCAKPGGRFLDCCRRSGRFDVERKPQRLKCSEGQPSSALGFPFSKAATQKRLAPMRWAKWVCVRPTLYRRPRARAPSAAEVRNLDIWVC